MSTASPSTASTARKTQDKIPTPERLERALDRREEHDVALAAASSEIDMHGYDELPFTD